MSIVETFAKTRNKIGSKIIKKIVDVVWGYDDVFFDDCETPRDPYANLSIIYENGFITKIIGIFTRSAAEELSFKLGHYGHYYREMGPVDALAIYAYSNRVDLYEAEKSYIANMKDTEWYMEPCNQHIVSPSYRGYRGGTIKFTKDGNYSIVFEEE